MRFHNIITQTQSQPCSLAGWFGGEEGLEDFVFDGMQGFRGRCPLQRFQAPVAQVGVDGDDGFVGLFAI
jgi:hypothetical protein